MYVSLLNYIRYRASKKILLREKENGRLNKKNLNYLKKNYCTRAKFKNHDCSFKDRE